MGLEPGRQPTIIYDNEKYSPRESEPVSDTSPSPPPFLMVALTGFTIELVKKTRPIRLSALAAIATIVVVICWYNIRSVRATSVRQDVAFQQATPVDNPPLVCPFGASACSGKCGRSCYFSARGEHCSSGQVCPAGTSVCGCSCYSPAKGEHCTPS